MRSNGRGLLSMPRDEEDVVREICQLSESAASAGGPWCTGHLSQRSRALLCVREEGVEEALNLR
jgi:hypothetical protein